MTFCGKVFSLCCMTGFIPLEDRENLEYLYRPYKALGGNGTGETLYHTVEKLPYQEQKEE